MASRVHAREVKAELRAGLIDEGIDEGDAGVVERKVYLGVSLSDLQPASPNVPCGARSA